MIAKILAGVFGVAVLVGGATVYHQQTGCCPLSLFSCSSDSTEVTTPEACSSCCSAAEETPSCCQQPARSTLLTSHGCCEDQPASTKTKGGQEVLLVEPREVK